MVYDIGIGQLYHRRACRVLPVFKVIPSGVSIKQFSLLLFYLQCFYDELEGVMTTQLGTSFDLFDIFFT